MKHTKDTNCKLNNDHEDKESSKKLLEPTTRIDNKIQKAEDSKSSPNEGRSSRTRDRYFRICGKCGVNPNLFFLKVTLFVMYGATASLLPYLTIHMQSIGLTVEDIAIIYLALPLTTFLAPPVTGYLVDKLGNYKPVVILSLVLNVVFHHSLLFIPYQETPGMMPAAYVVRHPATGKIEVWWSPCPSRECPDEEELDMVSGASGGCYKEEWAWPMRDLLSQVLDDCIDYCLLEDKNPKTRKNPVLPSDIAVMPPTMLNLKNSMGVPNVHLGNNKKESRSNKVKVNKGKDGKLTIADKKMDPKMNRTKQEDLRLIWSKNKTAIAEGKKKRKNKKKKADIAVLDVPKEESSEERTFFFVDMHPNLKEAIEQLGLEIDQDDDDNDTVTDFRTRFGPELLLEAGVNVTALDEFDLRCGGLVMATNLTRVKLKDLAADCMLQKCNFIDGGPEICPPDYKESDDRIFWIYFALRFIGTTMLNGCVTILDPIALVLIQEFGGEFGRERLFSSIGMALFSPLTGVLIDYYSEDLGYTDYSAAFYTFDVLLAISILTVCLMPVVPSLPADHILRDTLDIIKLPHVVFFIFFLFLLGNFWGFIESYVFLYLKELGASNYLLGITVTIGTISSMPFLYGAEKITKRFGHINIIVSAFLVHAVRLMGYSFIEEAWWCFPFEAMEALSVHLMWIAAATYCALLAPKNLLATLIGVLGMAHFSLGRGSGSFIGGLLIGTVGTRKSFRIMGLTAVTSGVIYYLLHYFWLRKLKAVQEIEAQHAAAGQDEGKDEGVRERPIMKDVAISAERLSLMIEFHHRGSLTSLDRNLAFTRNSASKVDMIRSNVEVNRRRNSNPSLTLKNSTPNLRRHGSFGKDKMTRDAVVTPMPTKKSVETMSTLDELLARRDSIPILEEEESSKDEVSDLGLEPDTADKMATTE